MTRVPFPIPEATITELFDDGVNARLSAANRHPDVMGKYQIDKSRIYLTGLSMGGYGTWGLGIKFPEKFAAIAPICGGGELIWVILSSREKGPALKKLAVWAFHGAKDPVVPLEESQRMVDAVKKAGVTDVKLTVYPEAQHDSWTATYENQELYDWFLQHERKPKPAKEAKARRHRRSAAAG